MDNNAEAYRSLYRTLLILMAKTDALNAISEKLAVSSGADLEAYRKDFQTYQSSILQKYLEGIEAKAPGEASLLAEGLNHQSMIDQDLLDKLKFGLG